MTYPHETVKSQQKIIKGTRWLLLNNPENLKRDKNEHKRLQEALEINQPLATAYYMKEGLRQIWNQEDKKAGEKLITNWMNLANALKIPMLMKFAKTMAAHKVESLHIMIITFQPVR